LRSLVNAGSSQIDLKILEEISRLNIETIKILKTTIESIKKKRQRKNEGERVGKRG
jgi:hypothetical protein